MAQQNAKIPQYAANLRAALRQVKQRTSGHIEPDRANAAQVPRILPDIAAFEAEESIDPLFDRAEQLAAYSGRFDPDDLFVASVPEAQRRQVLSRLAAYCRFISASSAEVGEIKSRNRCWQLRRDRRHELLSKTFPIASIPVNLFSEMPPTDAFGIMLRRVLGADATLQIEDWNLEDLLQLGAVLQELDGLNFLHPDQTKVFELTESRKFLAEYQGLLRHGFVGRDKEVDALDRFLNSSRQSKRRWSGMILRGLGGSGKSTLLAHFITELHVSQKATIVILDFDRPGLAPEDDIWLEAEFSRQIGCQYPQHAALLREAREETRQQRQELGFYNSSSSSASGESIKRSSRFGLMSIVHKVLHAGSPSKIRPLILVLDTFEEVIQRSLQGYVINWVQKVAQNLNGIPICVIISGRLSEDETAALSREKFVQATLALDEFEPATAELLLSKYLSNQFPDNQRITPEQIRRIAHSDFLPRRPLELRLLAQLVGEDKDNSFSLEQLESDVASGGPMARELFARTVYDRVLMRIKDEAARRLAHPGLVLRYVTPELVQEVLIPAMGLAPVTKETATRTVDILARHSWLAYRDNSGKVWHSKDLRRSMLKLMISKEPERADRIHRQATKFFARKKGKEESAERLYHQLMVETNLEEISITALKKSGRFLSEAIGDLPHAAAALLNYAINGTVNVDEIGLLPENLFAKVYVETGERLVSSGEYGTALKLLQEKLRSVETPTVEREWRRSLPLDWEIETLYATASWDLLEQRSQPLSSLQRSEILDVTDQFIHDLSSTARIATVDIAFSRSEFLRRMNVTTIKSPSSKALATSLETNIFFRRFMSGWLYLAQFEVDGNLVQESAMTQLQNRLGYVGFISGPRVLVQLLLNRNGLLHFWSTQNMQLTPDGLRAEPRNLFLPNVNQALPVLKNVQNAIITQLANSSHLDIEAILAIADSKNSRSESVILYFDGTKLTIEDYFTFLRGPDNEFRNPTRYALLEAFNQPEDWPVLAGILREVISWNVVDLEPETFVQSMTNSAEHFLIGAVELVDRGWLLGKLLGAAHAARPDSPKLSRVWAGYQMWNNAVRVNAERILRYRDTTNARQLPY